MGLLTIAVAFNALVVKKNDNILRTLSEAMLKYEINTPLRVSHFLSQMSHESAGFTRFQENLNYSSDGLAVVWPKRFSKDGKPNDLAKRLHRKPEEIANTVYANRMGNGNESSGDGWLYRGRGLIQLTFKNNYSLYSELIFGDNRLVENPDLALEVQTACKIACKFWVMSGCNELADRDDLLAITKKINGGTNGYSHRLQLLNKAKKNIGIL